MVYVLISKCCFNILLFHDSHVTRRYFGTVDFYGNTIQYSSEEELEYIKEFSERFDARTAPIFDYCHSTRGCCIPEVYNALTDIKNDEIKRLDMRLKYKVDSGKVACIKFL